MKSARHRFLSADLLGFAQALPRVRKAFLERLDQEGVQTILPPVNESLLTSLEQQGLSYITIADPAYPAQLLTLADPPIVLFYRGDITLLDSQNFQNTISIIGSRHATHEALKLTHETARVAAEAGLIVVSGLALGIDGQAHRGVLSSSLPRSTIAVLAQNAAECYPTAHQEIYDEILLQGGLIISEYPPGTKLYPVNFLTRNRIIAALSKMTVVTQAKDRSGALVTARLANEIGRDIGAFPWSVAVGVGAGSNRLIRDGAHCLLTPTDILALFDIQIEASRLQQVKSAMSMFTEAQKKAVQLLMDDGTIFIDDLKVRSGVDATGLCELEISGVVFVDHAGFVGLL